MNTKIWVMAFALLVMSIRLHGQTQLSASYQQCTSKAQGQVELDICADEDSRQADGELNRAYQHLLEITKSDERATSAIKASERLWVQYRDSYMKAMYPADDKQAAYGSIFPMEFHLLEASLTREHIKAINELIKQYIAP